MSRDDPQAYDDSDPMNPYRGYAPPTGYRPTSGMAIASFVCGLVFCLPMVTSLLAVVFGFVGLRETRNPYVKGRNWAVSGIVLGVLGVAFWLFAGSTLYVAFHMVLTEQAKAQKVATRFMETLSEGKVAEATEMIGAGVDRATLTAAVESMKASGPFNELKCDVQPVPIRGTLDFRFEVTGTAEFSRDSKSLRMSVERMDNGEYKVDRFRLGPLKD